MTTIERFSDGEGVSRRDFLKISGGALGAGSLIMLAGCGPASSSSDEGSVTDDSESTGSDAATTTEAVLGDGVTMRVGMEAAYAPFNWQATEEADTTIPIDNVDGAYADGYDVQIAKVIAEYLGMEAVAVKLDFGGLIDALTNGTIDIICAGMTATPERAESVDFSDTYLEDGVSLVVKADGDYADATTLAEFAGATVLGQKDTLYDEVIDQIPDVNHMTPVSTVPNVIEHLENDTCDAITLSTLTLPNVLAQYEDFKEVEFADGDGFEDADNSCNAGIAQGQEEILAKVNEAIASISDDERMELWNDCMDRQPA